jgi:predicted dehydrogenase
VTVTPATVTRARVGLVGAGPWAERVHAPMLAAEAGLDFAGVWARRPEARQALAERWSVTGYESYQALLDDCVAVAFAVPPTVQSVLAAEAARNGKHLLLEKPIGGDLPSAGELADAVAAAGVSSQVLFTWRYTAAGRAFLQQCSGLSAVAGRGVFLQGSALGGPFATPWRIERGGLLDLGPHVLDLLDAALGPITAVRAHANGPRWVGALLDHEGGAVSEVSLSAHVGVEPMVAGVHVYGEHASAHFDAAVIADDTWATVAREFASTALGRSHPLDARRGLYVQTLLAEIARQSGLAG